MVAARLSAVDLGRAAEFAEGDDQRRVEQAAAVEILDQGGDGVSKAVNVLVALEDAGVMVPSAIVERDERYARLDQAAGEQGALAERVAAVGVAHVVGLDR